MICCILWSIEICSAEIYREQDDFTGRPVIQAGNHCSEETAKKIEYLSFYKIILNSRNEYKLCSIEWAGMNVVDSDKPLQLNIDGDYTYEIPSTNKKSGSWKQCSIIIIDYVLSQDLIEKLNTANRVALRFTRKDGDQFVYVLPVNVLTEWKQVSKMEK